MEICFKIVIIQYSFQNVPLAAGKRLLSSIRALLFTYYTRYYHRHAQTLFIHHILLYTLFCMLIVGKNYTPPANTTIIIQ